jgi:hypothetical protein
LRFSYFMTIEEITENLVNTFTMQYIISGLNLYHPVECNAYSANVTTRRLKVVDKLNYFHIMMQ